MSELAINPFRFVVPVFLSQDFFFFFDKVSQRVFEGFKNVFFKLFLGGFVKGCERDVFFF